MAHVHTRMRGHNTHTHTLMCTLCTSAFDKTKCKIHAVPAQVDRCLAVTYVLNLTTSLGFCNMLNLHEIWFPRQEIWLLLGHSSGRPLLSCVRVCVHAEHKPVWWAKLICALRHVVDFLRGAVHLEGTLSRICFFYFRRTLILFHLRGAWRDRDTNDIFAHCSLIFYFLDFKFSNFVCPSVLHRLIWFFLKNSFRKKKNIRKTTQNALAPSIFIILWIALKLGTPLLHTQAQNTLLQNF